MIYVILLLLTLGFIFTLSLCRIAKKKVPHTLQSVVD